MSRNINTHEMGKLRGGKSNLQKGKGILCVRRGNDRKNVNT